ncbi:MAG TPA: CarD family transcriptional regulator [Anaerolineales bacterium]|nr:CarD family transcriptional regulator [Anaerolineales bacterium]
MKFQTDQWVVHCTHGLGQVLGIEERAMNGAEISYYVVQTADLTIWVPVDENVDRRLRSPNSPSAFQAALGLLAQPAEALPTDHRLRNQQLQARLKEGTAEAWFTLLRDLTADRHRRNWSDNDRNLLAAVRKALLGEWSFSLSITHEQAEQDLRRAMPVL